MVTICSVVGTVYVDFINGTISYRSKLVLSWIDWTSMYSHTVHILHVNSDRNGFQDNWRSKHSLRGSNIGHAPCEQKCMHVSIIFRQTFAMNLIFATMVDQLEQPEQVENRRVTSYKTLTLDWTGLWTGLNFWLTIAMSESPEVCQFAITEAISQHCYNVYICMKSSTEIS